MYQTVNFYQFHDAFMSIRPNNFTHEGLRELFGWIEEGERDMDKPQELDVIALCCEITEDTPLNIANGYNIDLNPDDDDYDEFGVNTKNSFNTNLDDAPRIRQIVLDYLCEHTTVVGQTDNSILFVNF
jgi:hypothetical protein